MTSKIFRSIILVAGSILAASFLLIFGIMYSYLTDELRAELKSEAGYVAQAVESGGITYLEQLPEEDNRITLIEKDGTVLYDSKVEISTMENHVERPEVQLAIENGYGEDTRYSDTLSDKTMYYAVRLSDGKILRVAQVQDTVLTLLLGLIHPVLYILALMFLLAAFLARKVAKKITEPMNNLDLEHPENNEAYDEIAPLLTKIHRQKRMIKEQLEDAKNKQEEFEMITENMEEGFLVIDSKMEILSCNSSTKRLFEIESLGKHQSVLTLNRTEKFQKIMEQVLEGRHQESEIELDESQYQLIANPVFQGKKREVAGAVLVFMDITERMQGERLRREFTANVSHELKTPLTSISGFAEIMQNGIVKPEDVPKFAGNIFRESQRLISLVNDIIKLSQLDEGMMPYEKEEVSVKALANEVALRLQAMAHKKDVLIEVSGENERLTTVRPVLEEILYNLCDNAIKYNKEKGSVKISIEKRAEGLVLSVTDTGIGIPVSSQSRIFERFYRVDKSHSKEIGGTGLGLSIVKHGAAYLGASLKLDSIIGVGTTVTLLFPEKN